MTKREKHEIAVTTRVIMKDDNDEIRKAYQLLHGSLKGLRAYVRQECIAFWTECEPYLDKAYLDYCWLKVGKKIVNLDDCWCFIRDGIKFACRHRAAELLANT